MISFGTQYWFILLLIVLLGAIGVVMLLYYKNKANNALSKTQQKILVSLRFLSFFLVAFLLLSPFIRNLKKVVQNPIIVCAWDNSSSVVSLKDSLQIKAQFSQLREELNEALGKEFELVEYTFGEDVLTSGSLNFKERTSNYGALIDGVINNHFNQNIGAMLLVGDGIYNQGKNPINQLNEINFPVYAIGMGDSSIVSDARIQHIRVNRTAFSGNQFPVEVDVLFSKAKAKPLKLSLLKNGNELQSVMLTPPNNNYFYTKEFILEASDVGLQHYSLEIETLPNERNTKNNRAGFVVNVLENKQKILILSDGSHPDIGALKSTLEGQKTFEVSVFTEEPYPGQFNDYNLLVLNQLPTSGKSAAQILSKAKLSRIPILFMLGNRTFLPQLNALKQGVEIVPLAGSGEVAQASYNPAYATFKLSEEFMEILPKFPPLQVPFADYELNNQFTPLFYQNLKGIETAKPLMATGKIDGRKMAFIFGEGIWKWRLFNYYQNQNHTHFNELLNQLIQYLALRENEDNFMVDYKPIYAETDDVIFTAEVYNDAYETLTAEEINITLKNSNNEDFSYTFDIQEQNYFLNAGHLPKGDYTFMAEVKVGNETFTETGSFTVTAVNIENVISRANHNMLYQLANKSGGKFYLPQQSKQLVNDLKEDNALQATYYFHERINDLLNLRWLFFVLLLLLSVEWFLRKYWGIY